MYIPKYVPYVRVFDFESLSLVKGFFFGCCRRTDTFGVGSAVRSCHEELSVSYYAVLL